MKGSFALPILDILQAARSCCRRIQLFFFWRPVLVPSYIPDPSHADFCLLRRFWSHAQPSAKRGYPPELAVAIGSIAITTCIAANFLLAHVATISRNKLAEIVMTRKKLWRTIAQKENAEAAAAARSDFIASASHEIRTPLHHLQGTRDSAHTRWLLHHGMLADSHICRVRGPTFPN